MNALRQWYYRRRFITAYRVLRNIKERHRAAGHSVNFHISNESYVHLECENCPWYKDGFG
jgi:hypothetical protein